MLFMLELRDLEVAIAKLPDEQRQVILLIGLEGMRYDQAAAILSIPIGTLRSRVSRDRDQLRILLGMDAKHRRGRLRPILPRKSSPRLILGRSDRFQGLEEGIAMTLKKCILLGAVCLIGTTLAAKAQVQYQPYPYQVARQRQYPPPYNAVPATPPSWNYQPVPGQGQAANAPYSGENSLRGRDSEGTGM